MHSLKTLRLNGADHDGPAPLAAGISPAFADFPSCGTYAAPDSCHTRHKMQAVAMTLACLGMLAPVHAQDAGRENLNGTRDATVERTASDPALGTVSATINVTGSSNVRGIWGKSDPPQHRHDCGRSRFQRFLYQKQCLWH